MNPSLAWWGTRPSCTPQAREIRAAVMRHVGVPVCVGVAATKTLAKFANRIAKQNPALAGVCALDAMPEGHVAGIQARGAGLGAVGCWRQDGHQAENDGH